MLTIRPFRNEDVPRLLSLWCKSQTAGSRASLMPLTMNLLQMQVLGIPFFDLRSISLAFDGEMPVGYVHATLGPDASGSDFSTRTGQICFLCVDPAYHDLWGASRALLKAGEQYLLSKGVEEIYGGSPRPCSPFYIGFHGGSEPLAFMTTDQHVIQVFQENGYATHQKTTRFRLDLRDYSPPVTPTSVVWHTRLEVVFNECPLPKNWWEACSLANFEWHEATAYLSQTKRPVARIRVRVANPDSDDAQVLYGGTWDAALMDVRVHPDFHRQGVGAYALGKMLRTLVSQNLVMHIEAHVAEEDEAVCSLLRSLHWNEIGSGILFRKEFGPDR